MAWNQALNNDPSYARESLRSAGYNDFLKEKCYDMIKEILELEKHCVQPDGLSRRSQN